MCRRKCCDGITQIYSREKKHCPGCRHCEQASAGRADDVHSYLFIHLARGAFSVISFRRAVILLTLQCKSD